MRNAQKQVLVLVLTLASVAILTRLFQGFGEKPPALEDFVFSQRLKRGYTIWGIQPGDSVPEILQEMPPNAKAEFTEREPLRGRDIDIVLYGPGDRILLLTTLETDKGEFVEKVRVDGGEDSTTLELQGKPVLRGRRLKDGDIERAFPGRKQIRGGYEAIKFGQRIIIEHGKNWIQMIELTLVDTAPRESE
jgi:hypothetical protein